jgi:iron-sulfur cluster repair protein YtfE (RIC family)
MLTRNSLDPSLKQLDPVAKQPERGVESSEMSPMEPPEAYDPPAMDPIALADLHPFLRGLSEEHVALAAELKAVEAVIASVKSDGLTRERFRELNRFLSVIDRDFIPHCRQEELALFPLLSERLITHGEHSTGRERRTAIDVMMEDHLRAIQLAAVILNFFQIASKLPDERSAGMVIEAALRETTQLVELLRLHMFREDNIVFASAQRLLVTEELDGMRPRS